MFETPVEETSRSKQETIRKNLGEKAIGDPSSCVPAHTTVTASFLIATVPDPINSHLALEYDRSLESLERAASTANFTFDRFWVPWDELYVQPQPDLEKARAVEHERRLRDEEPGLFLFHNWISTRNRNKVGSHGDHPDLLFVFLVGETPAYGINKVAFSKALLYIRDLSRRFHTQLAFQRGACDPAPIIGVAGPHFSASLHSLSRALESDAAADECLLPAKLLVVSGTVSNTNGIAELQEVASRLSTLQNSIIFQEVAFDDDARLWPIVSELKKITGAEPAQIAFLKETGSSYNPGSSPAWIGKEADKSVVQLYYPRGIAPLRNAYQAAQENQPLPQPSRQNQLPQVGLPLSYKESEIPQQETVAPAATYQTPLSQDAVLQQISRTIHQRNIKAVVLFATDTLDQLFLMRYLRETAPNIRVALVTADLLYVRPNDAHDFTGTLTFTPYPLYGSSTTLSGADFANMQVTFPSSLAEGEFLATLSLLHPNLRYANVLDRHADPVNTMWVAVLGKTGYWPMKPVRGIEVSGRVRKCDEKAANCSNLQSVIRSASASNHLWQISIYRPSAPSRLWCILALLVALAAGAHSLAVLATRFNLAHLRRQAWLECFCLDLGDRRYVQVRSFFLFIATSQVLIAEAVLLTPCLTLYRSMPASRTAILLLSLFAAVSTMTLAALLLCFAQLYASVEAPRGTGQLRERLKKHKQISYAAQFAGIASLMAVIIVIVAWAYLCRQPDTGLAFAERATALTSGVCPSLPMLLVATGLYLWAFGSLRRTTYFQNRAFHFPTEHFDEVIKSDFRNLQTQLAESLNPGSLPARFSVFCMVIGTFCFFLYEWLGPKSLESTGYDYLVLLGVFAIWSTLLFTTVRLVAVWLVLKKILRRLERLPIRYAFSRIPSTFSWSPVWRRGGMRRSNLVHARSLEYLRCLCGEPAAMAAAATGTEGPTMVRSARPTPESISITHECLNAISRSLADIVDLESKGYRVGCHEREALDTALLAAAADLTGPLAQEWALGGADAPSPLASQRRRDLPSRKEAASQSYMLAAEFIALRFVAVFRYVNLQMRNLLGIMSGCFIFALLALKSYPFQPREDIGWWLVIAFIFLTAAVVYVFVEMDRDAILCRISNNSPEKLDHELVWPLLRFGALPLLAIVAAQFPAVSNLLFSWVQPTLDSLH